MHPCPLPSEQAGQAVPRHMMTWYSNRCGMSPIFRQELWTGLAKCRVWGSLTENRQVGVEVCAPGFQPQRGWQHCSQDLPQTYLWIGDGLPLYPYHVGYVAPPNGRAIGSAAASCREDSIFRARRQRHSPPGGWRPHRGSGESRKTMALTPSLSSAGTGSIDVSAGEDSVPSTRDTVPVFAPSSPFDGTRN